MAKLCEERLEVEKGEGVVFIAVACALCSCGVCYYISAFLFNQKFDHGQVLNLTSSLSMICFLHFISVITISMLVFIFMFILIMNAKPFK